MMRCIVCDHPANINNARYFVIPEPFYVQNGYLLCDQHRDVEYKFEDFYNKDGSRKPIETIKGIHEDVIKKYKIIENKK